MQLLEQAILERGRVKDGEVLKVDAFLNHQMDVALINELGKEFYRRFGDRGVTKILTIEASGIGIACITAQHFGVPVVFAKKTQSRNIDGEVLTSQVTSFTHQRNYDIIVSARFLSPDDRVLLIDDFLAKGSAMLGLISLVRQSGATIVGALLIGVSRVAAAEFTFFLAVPVMFGLSAIKILKFGFSFTGEELLVLGIGTVVAFAVSVLVIKFLMGYIKKHDFKVFGWYRIALGLLVILLMVL